MIIFSTKSWHLIIYSETFCLDQNLFAIVKPMQDNEHKFLAVFPTTLLVYRSAIYPQGMTFKCGLECGLIMVVSIPKLGSWPSYRRITYSMGKMPLNDH